MANTLSSLIPTMYEGLDTVAREMVGFIPAVTRNTAAEKAALGQTIMVPITQASTLSDNTPAVTSPDEGDGTILNVPLAITKSKHTSIRWNGEQQKGMANAGTFNNVLANQFAQAYRLLCNAVEVDLAAVAQANASRVVGTAGTAPFGTAGDLSAFAQARKALDDNGVPQSDLHMVLNSAAVLNLRGKQTMLLKVNEAGDDKLLRWGSIAAEPVTGFHLHNSAGISSFTKGTGASYVTSGASAVGATQIVLATGTGTINPGDVISFAADANNSYTVLAGVSGPGTITIGTPGLRVAIPNGNAVTVGNSYTGNFAFQRSAIQLVARTPAMPVAPNGRPMDLAEDVVDIADPVSGLVFQVALYRQYRQMQFQVGLAWGVAVTKPDFLVSLLG